MAHIGQKLGFGPVGGLRALAVALRLPQLMFGGQIAAKDDGDAALSHACQLRSAHEFPPLTAALKIPYLAGYIQIGDRISQVAGRGVSMLTNAGTEQGEPSSYPYVVALTWDFQGENQSTTLQLSDRRAEPRRPTA